MDKFAALVKQIKKGDVGKTAELLQDVSLDINALDQKSGRGLLQIAMENDQIEIFNVLMCHPTVNPELISRDGELPLETAIRLNSIAFVSKILDSKINPKKKNLAGDTAFHIAIKNQTSKEIMKRLIHYFDLNEKIDEYGSYLNLAIVESQTENFLFLLGESKINYKATDQDDNTCLILAVKNNNGHAVVALLNKLQQDDVLTQMEKQFFINAQNKAGNTALHEACLKNLQTITEKIEKNANKFGLDITLKNKKKQTVQDIKINSEKNRLVEVQMEKKRKEEKVVRKRQKEEEKFRQKQEDEIRALEEKRRREKQQQKLLVEDKAKKVVQKSRVLWAMGIGFIIVLGLMYVAIVNAIENKKSQSL